MTYLNNSDTIGILAIIAAFIFSGMLYGAKAIDSNILVMVFVGVFGYVLMKFSAPLMVAGLIKKIYGKGMASHWNEVKKEYKRVANENSFSYDLEIPEKYMPKVAMPLPRYDLTLFEINRDDMIQYGAPQSMVNYPYPQITVFFRPSTNAIIGQQRKTLDQSIEWIEEHKEMFTKGGKEIMLPSKVTETLFGNIEVATENP